MPLPQPNSVEKKKDFLSRCMGDSVMNTEYDDSTQRFAVCSSLWKSRKRKESVKEGISDKPWNNVDKTKLPSSAFLIVGNPDKKSTWKLPYKDEDGNINLGALRAISAAVAGARTGKPMSVSQDVKDKIEDLLKKYKIGKYSDEQKGEIETEDVFFFEGEFAKINFTNIIKDIDTIGFYTYRRNNES